MPIDCLPDVLGTEHPVVIAERHGSVATPALPPNVADPNAWLQLKRPANADQRLPIRYDMSGRVEREYDWGSVHQWPTLNSTVKAVQFWFPLGAHEEAHHAAPAISETIREAIPAWTERLTIALEILTRQNLDAASFTTLAAHDTVLELVAGDLPKVDLPASEIRMTVTMPSSEHAISLAHWTMAVGCASDARQPSLVHLLLRDARHALRRDDFRRAVIDAGTTVEIAVSSHESHQLAEAIGSRAAEAVLGRFVALGARVHLGNLLGLPLGSRDLKKELVEPRNRATHQGAALSRPEALLAIQAATEVVDALVPDGFPS